MYLQDLIAVLRISFRDKTERRRDSPGTVHPRKAGEVR
jgi:hypothetical protein